MKPFLRALCGFFIAVSFTGCIEIFEDVTIEKNGSGHFQEKVDMSGAASMINLMKASGEDTEAKDSGNTQAVQSGDLSRSITEKWKLLEEMAGIRNLRIVSDTVSYKYTVDFDFDDAEALNQAILNMQGAEDKSAKIYTYSKSSFARTATDMSGVLDEMDGDDESSAEMARMMMADMKYHLTISVPGKIKSVSNKEVQVVGNNIAKLEASFSDLSEKKKTLEMEIRYK